MPFGNGSIVYTPKKWIGRRVTVVLQQQPFDVRSETMEMLKPHLGSVEGAFLFGSFARNEQTEESDVDVLVISSRSIAVKKTGRMDIVAKTREEFLEGLKRDRTLFLHQVLGEAKPILNKSLLEELRKKTGRPDYNGLLEDTIGAFKNVQDLLGASKKQGLEYLDSNTIVYSLILRIRGLLTAQSLAKKRLYSNRMLESCLKARGFSWKAIKGLEAIYRAEREGKKTGSKVRLGEAERLFEAAKMEFVKTEAVVKA